MGLLNWPPSRGPKPPHLQVVDRRIDAPPVGRYDFTFKPSRLVITERKTMLEAIGHPDLKKVEEAQVFTPDRPLPKGVMIRLKLGRQYLAGPTKRRAKYPTDLGLDYHVATFSSLTPGQAISLAYGIDPKGYIEHEFAPRVLDISLTYPLSLGVRLRLKPYENVLVYGDGEEEAAREMTVGYVLWMVAQEYLRIYEEHTKYRVWGHAIDDLYFTRLKIKGRKAELEVTA
jgi:hypothetical protein